MSSKNDPASGPQKEFLGRHDLLLAGFTKPEVVAIGIDPADITLITGDNATMHTQSAADDQAQAAAQEATKIKNEAFDLGESHYRAVRQRILKNPRCTPAITEVLGLARTEPAAQGQFAGTDPVTQLRGKVNKNGFAELKCKKGDADGADIFEKRDPATGFNPLARVLRFPWVDDRPVLVPGKPETRQYYAQLIKGNVAVGQPSLILTLIIPG